MRIVCDSCGAKYKISDDKVRGKTVKLRCKRCSHMIVVRGNEQEAEASAASTSGAVAAADAVWYIVRNGQQDGPHTVSAIQGFVASGEANAETYTWREGFGDWIPMSSVEELKHLVAAPAAAPVAAAPASMEEPAPSSHNYHAEAQIPVDNLPAMADFANEDEATRVAVGLFDGGGPASLSDLNSAAMSAEPSLAPMDSPDSMDPGPTMMAPGLFDNPPTPEPEPVAPAEPQVAPIAHDPATSMGGMDFNDPMGAPAPEPALMSSSPEPANAGFDDGVVAGGGFAAAAAALGSAGDGESILGDVTAGSGAMRSMPGGPQEDMVGARNENSVLFSINSLQQTNTASPAEEAPANTEASGLIDIRALSSSAAAVSNSRSENGNADPFGGNAIAPGPALDVPAMMPMGTRKSNAPLFIAIGAAVFFLVVIGGGLGAYIIFGGGGEEKTIVVPNPNTVAAAGTEAMKDKGDEPKKEEPLAEKKDEPKEGDSEKEAKKAEGDEGKEVAENKKEGDSGEEAKKVEKAAPAIAAKKANDKKANDKKAPREVAQKTTPKAPKAVAAKTSPAPKANKAPKGNSSIDDILSGIDKKKGNAKTATKTAPPKKKEPAKVAAAPPAAAKLTKSQVQGVVRRNYGRIKGCAGGQSGTVTVRFTISPSGSVGGAQVLTSAFKGTPAAGCITRVVRGMKFPSASSPLTISYPFKL